MQQRAKEFVLLLSLWVGMCLVPAAAVSAQDERPREHVYLPPVSGATPLSTMIDAQAHYLVAYGDCLESMAIARKIHAEAYQIELRNAVDEVDAYFKRRELNRLWRRKENPDFMEHEARRQAATRTPDTRAVRAVCRSGLGGTAELATDETLWSGNRPSVHGKEQNESNPGLFAKDFRRSKTEDLGHRRRARGEPLDLPAQRRRSAEDALAAGTSSCEVRRRPSRF